MQALTTLIVVIGHHITENLEHHKKGDVIRILEEKGFKEKATHDIAHFYAQESSSDTSKRTLILLDDGDFVLPEVGVQLFDNTSKE